MKNDSAIDVFNKRAQLYQEKYMDVSLYAPSLDAFCNSIAKPNAKVLEIACGPGNMTKYVLQKRPDLQLLGTDLASNMLELAKANNPQAQFQLLDAREINRLNQTFDAVLCGFVTPYLSLAENTKMMEDSYALLNTGGVFYHSTILAGPQQSGYQTNSAGDKVYVHYYTQLEMMQMLEKSNFQLLHQFHIPYLYAGATETHLILIAQKN